MTNAGIGPFRWLDYAGPDVLASLPDEKEATIQKFESAIRNGCDEGTWLFYSWKNQTKLDPVALTLGHVSSYTCFNPFTAKIRLNWGGPETPELVPSDLIHAAQLGLIRPDEFRDKAVKFAGNSGKTKPPEILAVTMCWRILEIENIAVGKGVAVAYGLIGYASQDKPLDSNFFRTVAIQTLATLGLVVTGISGDVHTNAVGPTAVTDRA